MLKSTLAAVAAVLALSALSPAALAAKGDPHVLLTTSAGNIELELNSLVRRHFPHWGARDLLGGK